MADLNSIFQRWLETGELTDDEKQRLMHDKQYSALLQNGKQWQALSETYQETPVPDWDRGATWYDKTASRSWWESINRYFAPAALACSLVMCSLVLMRAEVTVAEQGISISFQNTHADEAVTFEQLQTLLAAHQQSSTSATFALVKEAIEQSRLERKEDISALVSHLNQIRQQDQALVRLQLHELAEQVDNQPLSSIAKN